MHHLTHFFPSFSSFANLSNVLLQRASSFSAGCKPEVSEPAVDLMLEVKRDVRGSLESDIVPALTSE